MTPAYWLVVAAVMGLAGSLTLAVYRTVTGTSERAKFDEALTILRSSEITDLVDPDQVDAEEEIREKGWSWSRFWLLQAQRTGRNPEDPGTPGRIAAGGAVLGLLFGVLVFPGGAIGVMMGPTSLVLATAYLGWEANKRAAMVDKQLPLLLAQLRSHMHAGVTVQAALIAVADDLPSPLGDEVRSVKRDVNVSIPLEQALDTLAARVKSRQMQFLVSSIGIAVRSGSDLVPQLVVIEEIAMQRARIDGKIKAAVALAKPTSYLALAIVPMVFLYYAFTDSTYLEYYQSDGMILGIIGVILYFLGYVTIRLLIKNVENT